MYPLLHFIADNVEHYAKTLDGEDVIQMMSQKGAITPASPSKNKIPRIKVTLEEIRNMGQHTLYNHISKGSQGSAHEYQVHKCLYIFTGRT